MRLRMPSSSECMPSWPWRIRRSRTFSPESSSAVGEAVGSRDDGARTSTVESQGLPYCRPVAGGAVRESTDRIERDSPVVSALNETVERHGRWGFWKCFQRLRDQGHAWNHKRVHRVYCSMKLNLPHRTKKRVITRERQPLHPGDDFYF